MLDRMKAAIFDLDGVIVDTAKYHFQAWRRLANSLGFDFTEEDNLRLKGVSRMKSLEIILEMGHLKASEEETLKLADLKNTWYVELVGNIDKSELLPGVVSYIDDLKKRNVKIALGSASKNAVMILDRLGIKDLFDAIVDGTKVAKSKPDPEVFTRGARELCVEARDCVVFEDAAAGIRAAKNAGMYAVGIGTRQELPEADLVVKGLFELVKSAITL